MKFVVTSLTLLLLGSSAQALAETVPVKCPSVDAIRAVEFDKRERIDYSLSVFQFNHSYDTEQNWDFELGDFEVHNSEESSAKLANALQSLTSTSAPMHLNNEWWCWYTTNDSHVTGLAFTPSRGES